jgi:hypothetical protein
MMIKQLNGHDLVPLHLPEHGPVSGWPQPDDPGQPGTAADETGRWRHAVAAHHGWAAAVPIVLVNAVAFAAQLAFLRQHLPWQAAGQVLVAVALESIAVYLAWQAHLAQLADDSAMRLRLAAYGMAALIGAMNYSHYAAPGWRPTFPAVAFGMASAISPWLWSVHSRRESRDALKARGLIEPHAVRLGATRWAWHPVLSLRVMRWAAWSGEADPARAIAGRFPPAAATPDDAGGDSGGGTGDSEGDSPPPPPPPAWQSMPPGRDKAAAIMADLPGLSVGEVAELAACDRRTVQRARTALAGKGTS